MKKYVSLIFFAILIGKSVLSQYTAIPDNNFEQALIDLGYDSGIPDGQVLTSNINTVMSLAVNDYNISDLTGIESFSALLSLYCRNNQINNLNLTQNTSLFNLLCDNNNLSSIDVTQNSFLRIFSCGNNNLTQINVSQNPNLEQLICDTNQLTSLDISQNNNLVWLFCNSNQLSNLDVTQNALLDWLYCNHNEIASLDLTQNSVLQALRCFNNQLSSLDVSQNSILKGLYCSNNNLNYLDISQNTELLGIECNSNELLCLNLKNGGNYNFASFKAYDNPNLTCIEVDNPSWSTAVWTNNQIDPGAYFSNYCGNACTTSLEEFDSKQIELVKVVNLMGQEVNSTETGMLIFIYTDGTTEKRIFQ